MLRGDQAGSAEGTQNKEGVEIFNVSSLSVKQYSKLPCKGWRRKLFPGVLWVRDRRYSGS